MESGDLALIHVMTKAKRIYEETVENLNGLFRYCFLMVGLREKNFPNELETLFLHQFIRENYGGHSCDEVKMAFRMAVKGDLDLGIEDVTAYENFSVLYLSRIINSYRRWSSEEFRRLEKFIPPHPDDVKLLEAPIEKIHWGEVIEKEYQHFLSFGDERWRLYPIELYKQLSNDGAFDFELFRKAMSVVRRKLMSELQHQKAVYLMQRFDDNSEDEKEKTAKSINQTNVRNLDEKMNQYKSSDGDREIEFVAKQYCVLQFFKNSKQNMSQHIYISEEKSNL